MINDVRGSLVGIVIAFPSQSVITGNLNQPPPALPDDFAKCFDDYVKKCVVGTGFIVNERGDVVTASHVLDEAASMLGRLKILKIQLANTYLEVDEPNYYDTSYSQKHIYQLFPFRVRVDDKEHDIAVLSSTELEMFNQSSKMEAGMSDVRVPPRHPQPVILDPDQPRDGDEVFACGYPLNAQDITTYAGHVATAWATEVLKQARDHGILQEVDVYRLDLTADFGDSGGPVFSTKNRSVIGMVIAAHKSPAGAGTTTAIPTSYITQLLDKNHISWKALIGRR